MENKTSNCIYWTSSCLQPTGARSGSDRVLFNEGAETMSQTPEHGVRLSASSSLSNKLITPSNTNQEPTPLGRTLLTRWTKTEPFCVFLFELQQEVRCEMVVIVLLHL